MLYMQQDVLYVGSFCCPLWLCFFSCHTLLLPSFLLIYSHAQFRSRLKTRTFSPIIISLLTLVPNIMAVMRMHGRPLCFTHFLPFFERHPRRSQNVTQLNFSTCLEVRQISTTYIKIWGIPLQKRGL